MAGGMKEGDWNCAVCGDHQFARNASCRKCGAPKGSAGPAGGSAGGMMGNTMPGVGLGGGMTGNMQPGDWSCAVCGDHQFARNTSCRKCGAPKGSAGAAGGGCVAALAAPGGLGGGMTGNMQPGDWSCAVCGDHQFARNTSCRKCGAPKGSAGAAGGGCGAAIGGCAAGGGFGGDMKPGDWNCPSCQDLQFARNAMCRRCGTPRPHTLGGNGGALAAPMAGFGGGGGNMKPGDWICANCQDHQYARNETCRRCGAAKPPNAAAACGALGGGNGFAAQPLVAAAAGAAAMGGKPGDWVCQACGDLQFARNASCRRCGGPKPADAGMGGGMAMAPMGGLAMAPMAMPGGMKPGDWSCPACGDHQFARNETCRRCGGPKPAGGAQVSPAMAGGAGFGLGRPAQEMKPGDWHCPSCQDLQFARNTACRKCGTPKPADAGADGRPRSRSPRR